MRTKPQNSCKLRKAGAKAEGEGERERYRERGREGVRTGGSLNYFKFLATGTKLLQKLPKIPRANLFVCPVSPRPIKSNDLSRLEQAQTTAAIATKTVTTVETTTVETSTTTAAAASLYSITVFNNSPLNT